MRQVKDHARQLLEKYIGKPFLEARYAGSSMRMSSEDVEEGLEWLDDRFHVIRYEDDELPSVDWVLNLARAAVLRCPPLAPCPGPRLLTLPSRSLLAFSSSVRHGKVPAGVRLCRYGIRGLVIDPYNELDHQRPVHMTETEYVSQMLTRIKRFAQHNDVHVWFVAHPRQLQGWKGEPPNLYDISGSAHFINKADNGIVIHRNRDAEQGPLNQVRLLSHSKRLCFYHLHEAPGCRSLNRCWRCR
jgi:twinkle protein